VRAANEDDYLVLAAGAGRGGAADELVVVADGMGGAVGGGEASRAAVRALAAAFVAAPTAAPGERLRLGFAAASARVHEVSKQLPSLRDMGTTLTAVSLHGDRADVGHVGDSRAVLLRGGALAALTEDHAIREPDNVLTRCIGGGQANEVADFAVTDFRPGDVLALLTDGVWSTVAPADLLAALQRTPAQAAAEQLIELALAAGGPDNATAVVVRCRAGTSGEVELALPREERPRTGGLRGRSLRPRLWPWLLLVAACAVGTMAALRWSGVFVWHFP
jgi:protein phosphatase